MFCISHRFFLFHLNARCSLFDRQKNFHNLARPRCIATVAQIQLDFMKVVNLGISTAENKTKSIPFAENDLLQSSKGAKNTFSRIFLRQQKRSTANQKKQIGIFLLYRIMRKSKSQSQQNQEDKIHCSHNTLTIGIQIQLVAY